MNMQDFKNSSEALLPDDAVHDLTKESQVNLLQLNPVEVSTQLMVEDAHYLKYEQTDCIINNHSKSRGTTSLCDATVSFFF